MKNSEKHSKGESHFYVQVAKQTRNIRIVSSNLFLAINTFEQDERMLKKSRGLDSVMRRDYLTRGLLA